MAESPESFMRQIMALARRAGEVAQADPQIHYVGAVLAAIVGAWNEGSIRELSALAATYSKGRLGFTSGEARH